MGREKKKPLFLFLHHYLCHDPYLKGPQEFRLRFLEKKADGLPVKIEDIATAKGDHLASDSFWEKVDLSKPAHKGHIKALYDGGVYYSDYVFKEFMQFLKDQKIYDDSEQKPEIIKKMKATVRELRKRNREFLASLKVGNKSTTKADRKVLDQLKSLGYVN